MCDHQQKDHKRGKTATSKSQPAKNHHQNQGHHKHRRQQQSHQSDDTYSQETHSSAEDNIFSDHHPDHRRPSADDRAPRPPSHQSHQKQKRRRVSLTGSPLSSSTSSSSHSSSSSSSSASSSPSSFSSSSLSSSSSSSASSSSLSSDTSRERLDKHPLKKPQHSQSCTDISGKRSYFEEGDDTAPLIDAGGDHDRHSARQKREGAKSSRNRPTRSKTQKIARGSGKDGSFRKSKSMEALSGPKDSEGNEDDNEQETSKSEARKNLMKEKMKFSAFLNEITRQVLSPMRLTTLGVTDAQRPCSPRPASARKTGSGAEKHRQQRSRATSADSVTSSRRSHTSQRSTHLSNSKSFQHHHTYSSADSPTHRPRSCTDISCSTESPSQTPQHHNRSSSCGHHRHQGDHTSGHHHHHHHYEECKSPSPQHHHRDHHNTRPHHYHGHHRHQHRHGDHHSPTHHNNSFQHHRDHHSPSHHRHYGDHHHGDCYSHTPHHGQHHSGTHHHRHHGDHHGPARYYHHGDHHGHVPHHHHGDHHDHAPPYEDNHNTTHHYHHGDLPNTSHHDEGPHTPTHDHGDHKSGHHHHSKHPDTELPATPHRNHSLSSNDHKNHHNPKHHHHHGDDHSPPHHHHHGDDHSPPHHHHHGDDHSPPHHHRHGDDHSPSHHHIHGDDHSQSHHHHHGDHHGSGHQHHHGDRHDSSHQHHHRDHHSSGHQHHHGDHHSESHQHHHGEHHSESHQHHHGDHHSPGHQHHHEDHHADSHQHHQGDNYNTSHHQGHPLELHLNQSYSKNSEQDHGDPPTHLKGHSADSPPPHTTTQSPPSLEEERTSFTDSSAHKEKAHELGRIMVLQEKNEGLHQNLLKTAVRMECLGEEFVNSQKILESELQKTRMELSSLTDRFKRLHDSCSSTQHTNNLLQQKLHSVAQNMEGERERLNHRISALTEQLADAKFGNSGNNLSTFKATSVLHKTNIHFQSDNSINQVVLPIAPPPAQFMDSHNYGNTNAGGQEQPLGSVPEEEESDWSEFGEEIPRFILTGSNRNPAWRHQEADLDKDSESGGEETLSQSAQLRQTSHLQFKIPNENLPAPQSNACPSGFMDLSDSMTAEGNYRITSSPNLGSSILIRSASLEEIPLARHHMQKELRGTEAMMDLHHPRGEVIEDLDNEIIHHWRTNSDREAAMGMLAESRMSDANIGLASLQSAEQMLNHFIRESQASEGKGQGRAEVHGWMGGIPDEVLRGERTKL